MMRQYDTQRISRICEEYRISLIILHGSHAKGAASSVSDIDIGILGEPNVIKDRYFDILKDFSSVFGDKFDPVFLNGAEPMICYQAAINGLPLYEKTKGLFSAFKTYAMARYLDTKKFRLLEDRYIKSSIEKMA